MFACLSVIPHAILPLKNHRPQRLGKSPEFPEGQSLCLSKGVRLRVCVCVCVSTLSFAKVHIPAMPTRRDRGMLGDGVRPLFVDDGGSAIGFHRYYHTCGSSNRCWIPAAV